MPYFQMSYSIYNIGTKGGIDLWKKAIQCIFDKSSNKIVFLAFPRFLCFWRMKDASHNVTSKKSPNVLHKLPKRISLEKWNILTPLQKLPKNMGNFRQNNCCHRLWKVSCPKCNKSPNLVTLDVTKSGSNDLGVSAYHLPHWP